MKSDSTTVIKNMEFLVKELHKEWDRSGASKAYYGFTNSVCHDNTVCITDVFCFYFS